MKLKDLSPQPGQVFERLDYTPKQVAMIDYSGRHATIVEILSRSMSCVLFAQVEGDWLLLQPAPVLGEAVSIKDLNSGDRLEVVRWTGEQYQGRARVEKHRIVVDILEHDGTASTIYGDAGGYKFHIAPSLPALPPEPSLREKIVARLKQSDLGLVPTHLNRLADDLEALLGGSHDDSN